MEKIDLKKNWIDWFAKKGTQNTFFAGIVTFNVIVIFFLVFSPVTSIKGSEPNVMYTIEATMLNRQSMFQDPEIIPFSATQYTPLYYIICSTICTVAGFVPGQDVVAIYAVGRLISFTASLGVAYFIFLLLNRIFSVGLRWSLWIAVACVFCTIPWYLAVRPDSLMAFFFFSTIYFFCRYLKANNSNNVKWILLAGIMSAFSFFAKQNGLLIFLVIGSFLVLNLKIKGTFTFGFSFIIGLAFCAVLFVPFYSDSFFKNVTQGLNNGIDIQNAISVPYFNFISRFGLITVLAIFCLLAALATGTIKAWSSEFKFVAFVFICLLPFSVITALKIGADINYFHEVIALSFIILAITYPLLINHFKEEDTKLTSFIGSALFFTFCISVSLSSFLEVGARAVKRFTEKDDVYNQDVIRTINAMDKSVHILSDFAFVNNAFPKQCIVPQPDISLLWYDRKVYNFENLKNAISNGTVEIYVGNGAMLRYFEMDLNADFRLLKDLGEYKIYINKHAKGE